MDLWLVNNHRCLQSGGRSHIRPPPNNKTKEIMKTILLLVALATLAITGCKKDNTMNQSYDSSNTNSAYSNGTNTMTNTNVP
jgi:hypothetical protein